MIGENKMNKSRPIIMSGESVRAILDGNKIQTRRPIKRQLPINADFFANIENNVWEICQIGRNPDELGHIGFLKCPYGEIGDELWVRETWANDKDYISITYYRADKYDCPTAHDKWKSSIFMSRRASRITLEITDIRVKRLQDMTLNDVKDEGMRRSSEIQESLTKYVCNLYNMFKECWNKLNKKPELQWESNPWVWVIEFKKKI